MPILNKSQGLGDMLFISLVTLQGNIDAITID